MGPESNTCAGDLGAAWIVSPPGVVTEFVPLSVPPGVDVPASLACRLVLLPNAFIRPIRPPAPGVVGVCKAVSFPQGEESSAGVVVPAVDTDPRRARSEK